MTAITRTQHALAVAAKLEAKQWKKEMDGHDNLLDRMVIRCLTCLT
jgi:hypothetical protein